MTIRTHALISRIGYAAHRAARHSDPDSNADLWHCVLRAVIRATRRECGLSSRGPAPALVYATAQTYADRVAAFPGFAATYRAADLELLPAIREIARRARLGTL